MQLLLVLKSISRAFAKRQPAIVDVVLFGSAARAKARPSDIDICLLTDNQKIPIHEFERAILARTGARPHISVLRLRDWLSPRQTLWKTILHEGISLLRGRPLAQLAGFKPIVLFWYSLEKLKPSDKVRFSYALYGRPGKAGLLQKVRGEVLGKAAILVPIVADDQIRELLTRWQLPYNRRRILIEL